MKVKKIFLLVLFSFVLNGGCRKEIRHHRKSKFYADKYVVWGNIPVTGTMLVADSEGKLYLLASLGNSLRCFGVVKDNARIVLRPLWKSDGISRFASVSRVDLRTNFIVAISSINPIKPMNTSILTYEIKLYSLSLKTGEIIDSIVYLSTNRFGPVGVFMLSKNWVFVEDKNIYPNLSHLSKHILIKLNSHGEFEGVIQVQLAAGVQDFTVIDDKYSLISFCLYNNLVNPGASGIPDWLTGVALISLKTGRVIDYLSLDSGTYGTSFLTPTSSPYEWIVNSYCYFCERCGSTIYKISTEPLEVIKSKSFKEGVVIGDPFEFDGRLNYPVFLINSQKLLILNENLEIEREIPCSDCEFDSVAVLHFTSMEEKRGTMARIFNLKSGEKAAPTIVVMKEGAKQSSRDPSSVVIRAPGGKIMYFPEIFIYYPPYDKLAAHYTLKEQGDYPDYPVVYSQMPDRAVLFYKLEDKIKVWDGRLKETGE